jgi:phosphatidylglycerophosphate synthase
VDGETARLHGRTSRFGAMFDAVADRMVDAAVIAGLWLWSWDDPSRMFRIEIIAASMIGWAILSQILYEPFDVISRFDEKETPPATALLGARDSRLFLIAAVSVFDQPVPAFLVGAFAYLSSGLHRILLVGKRGRDAPAGLAPPDQVRDTA